MLKNIDVYFLRVFTDEKSNFGDKASIIIDEGRQIADVQRQSIARELNTGETIFVNNIEEANISVMHPQGEIGFAGVGTLAAAYLLAKLRGKSIEKLIGRDGDIDVWQEGENTWVCTSVDTLPKWHIKQLENSSAVESIKLEDTTEMGHTIVWAWIDEDKGIIRARTFAKDWEIPEAEANGSGSMKLASKVGRKIKISHGKGSVIYAKPEFGGLVSVGGRVIQAENRALAL